MKIKIAVRAEREFDPQAIAEAIGEESNSGEVTVDESSYDVLDVSVEKVDGDPSTGTITLSVEFDLVYEVERTEGKFISKSDLAEEIIDSIPDEIEHEGLTFDVVGKEFAG